MLKIHTYIFLFHMNYNYYYYLGPYAYHVSPTHHSEFGPSTGHRKCIVNIQSRPLRRANKRTDTDDRLLQNHANILSIFHTNESFLVSW